MIPDEAIQANDGKALDCCIFEYKPPLLSEKTNRELCASESKALQIASVFAQASSEDP